MKKAIIKFFRAILRREVKVMNDPAKPFNLCVIDPDNNILTEALGISPERVQELGDASEKALITAKDVIQAQNLVAPMCKHINEYFFCSYVIFNAMERMRNPLSGLLGTIMAGRMGPSDDNK